MKENAAGIRYLNNNLLMQRSTIENESFHRPNAYGFGRLVFFGIELNIFGIKLDQWMHDGPGEEEVSLFFADDRVVAKVIAKAVGRRVPQNIFGSATCAVWANRIVLAGPRIDMTIDDVRKLFGGVKRVDHVLNGQSASRHDRRDTHQGFVRRLQFW